MIKKTKKTQSKQNIFKLTTNKVFAIAIVVLLLISIMQTYFIYYLWQIRDMDNLVQNRGLLVDSNMGLYELGKEHVITTDDGVLIPEANIKLPKNSQMYGLGGLYDETNGGELSLMNRSSLFVGASGLNGATVQELYTSVPKAQACTRQVIVKFDNSEINEGYEEAFSKTLNDGRVATGYKSTICPDGADEFANYIAGLESY